MSRAYLPALCVLILFALAIADCVYAGTLTVTNLNDSGEGSLRCAIEQANANSGPDTINFSVSGTISLLSGLPMIENDGTVIDASSQWLPNPGVWPVGQPGVTLDGQYTGGATGLAIYRANDCHIRGLFVTKFKTGISIGGGGQRNTIGGIDAGYRNVISGNDFHNFSNGVIIVGSGTNHNVVLGNYIGTDANGTADLGNSNFGIQIFQGAHHNTIGGSTPGARNIISGNGYTGVGIWDPGSDYNEVSGNYIGTNLDGTAGLGNHIGINIVNGAQYNIIGGSTSGAGNIISGNNSSGLDIGDPGTNYNVVIGNYIGTDANGTAALGNSEGGVGIWIGAQSNVIGGTTAEERNIISGNDCQGISIGGTGTINNVISGNYVGTDANGTADLGNSSYGIQIFQGAQHNTIGGSTPGERNIISGNNNAGVGIGGSGTNNNIVSGNYIGTDVTGGAVLGNSEGGVGIHDGAHSNTIGGATPGERNVISGNDGSGVNVAANSNKVSGNYIGTDVTGSVDLGNSEDGVAIGSGAHSNIIGGTTPNERNVISGNDWRGVDIAGPGTTSNNIVLGNYIGTDAAGIADLGNSWHGVAIREGAQFNTIGGTGNTISFNDSDGVQVSETDTDYNKISVNSIHNNSGLGIRLAYGGNDEIPAPSIISTILAGDTLHVEGENAGASATVEIFEADSPESGEGMTYLGSLIADGTGDFSGNINVTGKGLEAGEPVTSTTTHTSNNTSQFSPTVTVQSHVEAINDMVATVEAMNLQEGFDNSLDTKLETARDSLEAANAGLRSDAARKLEAFINAVEAQRGKQLSDEQADELVSLANSIISALRGVSGAPAKQSRLSPDRKLSTVWGKIKAK